MTDIGLYAAYALTLIAVLAFVGFELLYLLRNLKEAKWTLIGIGALVVIFLVGYAIAPSDFYFKGMEQFKLSANQVKLIGGGLNTFYILAIIAIVAAVVSEVSGAFNK